MNYCDNITSLRVWYFPFLIFTRQSNTKMLKQKFLATIECQFLVLYFYTLLILALHDHTGLHLFYLFVYVYFLFLLQQMLKVLH